MSCLHCSSKRNLLKILEFYPLNVVENLNDSSHIAVGGKTVNAVHNYFWSSIHQWIISFWQREINTGLGADLFLTSNNMAVRKMVFDAVHGFDELFAKAGAEDRNLARTLSDGGYPVDYCDTIVVCHHHELTFKKFARHQFHYGQGSFILYYQTNWNRQQIPWHLLLRLLRDAWSGSSMYKKSRQFLAVLFSQACVGWGFLRAAFTKSAAMGHGDRLQHPTTVPALLFNLLPLFTSAAILVSFGAVNWAMVSRMLNHENIGILASLLSLHLILWPITNICTSSSMIRLTGSDADAAHNARANLIFRTGFAAQISITLLICAVILAMPGTWIHLLFKGQIQASHLGLLVLGLLGMTCYEFFFLMASARLKFRTMAMMQVMLSTTRLAALSACFLFAHSFEISMIFSVYMASYWIPLILQVPVLRGMFHDLTGLTKPLARLFSMDISKKLLRYGSWVSMANILASMNQHLGALLLLQWGREREAGIFGLALMCSAFVVVFLSAIQQYLLPYACRLEHRENMGRFYRSSLKVSIPVIVLTGSVVSVGYFIFPIWLGEKGAVVFPVFALICLSHFIAALFRPLHNLFHFLKKPYLISADLFVRLAVLLPITFWLIPRWGALGMAAAQLGAITLSSVLTFTLYRYQLRHQPGVDF